MKTDYSTFQSPFTWRYGSDKMRQIFSEENKFLTWRKIWVELAKAQYQYKLVSRLELNDLIRNEKNLDIERILEIEKETGHDTVAAIKEFAEKATIGGGKIHLGATSMDIVDNTDTLRAKQAMEIVETKLVMLLKVFADKITELSLVPTLAYTHLQAAEQTTIGYRLALYAQDLLLDFEQLQFVKKQLKAKGLKGAVGTAASYTKLVGEKETEKLETEVMDSLEIEAVLIAGQTSPRKFDVLIAQVLSSIAQSMHKFAFDMRVLQSAGFGEWVEPFGKKQVGSSAMPFKKNPVKSEQICSIARLVVSLERTAWDNAALSLLERTIDDSANRRSVVPEMFLATDEILSSGAKIVKDFTINQIKVKSNLAKFAPFTATEEIIIKAVKKGADRQRMHEIIRDYAIEAWEKVQNNEPNFLSQNLTNNTYIAEFLSPKEIETTLSVSEHLGTASQRAKKLVQKIHKAIK
jgi:adenylosuccinate lyase